LSSMLVRRCGFARSCLGSFRSPQSMQFGRSKYSLHSSSNSLRKTSAALAAVPFAIRLLSTSAEAKADASHKSADHKDDEHKHASENDAHTHHEMTDYLSRAEVTQRVFDVLRQLPKLKQAAMVETAHFQRDLGLDSLDIVESVIAVEEEFRHVFPDDVAEQIETIKDLVDVLCTTPYLDSIHAEH